MAAVALDHSCKTRTLTRWQLGGCRPLPKLPLGLGGLSRLLSLLISMRVGVSNLYLSGRVRLSLAPLLNRLPVVAALTVGFRCVPGRCLRADCLWWLRWRHAVTDMLWAAKQTCLTRSCVLCLGATRSAGAQC